MKLTVIGAGPGGYVAAIKAAQLGADVTVIEDIEVGGTCLNRGCIPTKALLYSSAMFAKATQLSKYGIVLEGTVTPDLIKMMQRKDKVVATQVKGIRALFKSWGIKHIAGRGKLTAANTVEVTGADGAIEAIESDKVIIATGSRPSEIPTFPFDGQTILSSDDALRLTEIPESMLIVGAGVIGSEFACIYSDLGCKVTMVEMLERPVATEDTEVSALLTKELKKKKIKLITGIGVTQVTVNGDSVTATLSDGAEIQASKILVSIGRAYNSANIGLQELGIELGPRGEIKVNKQMQTSLEGVYAVGDVTGGILLAHTASTEGIVAANNICGKPDAMDYSSVPAAIFTTPEIASVGMRDFEAEQQGIKTKTGMFQYRGLGKSHAMGEITGFFKIIADADTDKVLGVHIVGSHASDIIHEGALAIRHGLTTAQIADTIHAHPTLSEGLMEAAENVHGQAIHSMKKQ